eukprot:12806161-Alexandrium_andersonii.AAC.1
MMLACFTTGWARLVRQSGVGPRALADDFMVEAVETAPEAAFRRAVVVTLDLLEEARCVVSVDKRVIVDGAAAGREAKGGQRWGPRGVKMKVATNVRDLGAHLNVHAAT